MASIINDPNGLRRLQFMFNGTRRTIRLGHCPAKDAERIKTHVEAIVSSRLSGVPLAADTSSWLAEVDAKLHGRLVASGLAGERKASTSGTVGELITEFKRLHSASLKSGTAVAYGHTLRNLAKYFGNDTALSSIDNLKADGFRMFLKRDQNLSLATVNRRIVATKTIFRRALRWGMTTVNPFADVVGGGSYNDDRKQFIPQADAMKLLEACPNAEWRVLVVLSRFGGLRVPSEADGLTWADVNWDAGTLHVKSPKTEHHQGQASRTVPLFPELRKVLMEAFEQAEPGTSWVIVKHRGPAVNLRTHLERIVLRAGLTPWPRLWHNMRASRQSELMADYGATVKCCGSAKSGG